jgi:ribosomal-protein-alanine N-acetyltransferase
VRLGPVTPADAEALAAVHAEGFDPPWRAEAICEVLAGPGAFGFAVRDEVGAALGFILARAIAGEAEVLTIAVRRALRRQGLARALLAAATACAEATHTEAMFLEVAADNAAAIAFYAAAGFVRVGVRPGYYPRADGPVDALVMRRDLNTGPG